jgi:uncharacterized tellurite resistance protein B-like protein
MKKHVETITNLLLGAAYADKRLEGREVDSIRETLCKLLGTATLPPAQADQIAAFNPAKFDAAAAAASLRDELDDEHRRKLVALLGTVTEADDELDLDEQAYVHKVGTALGFSSDELAELGHASFEEDEFAVFFDED